MTTTSCPLTPALLQLVKASILLKTTNTNAIAVHLHRSPATIRTEFQRILLALNVHCRYTALRLTEEEGWLDN